MRRTYLLGGWLLLAHLCTITWSQGQQLNRVNKEGQLAFHPKISFDGTKMVFMADYDGRPKPYISEWENSEWSEPTRIFQDNVDGSFQFSYPILNARNNRLYLSAKPQDSTHFDIYYSDLVNNQWSAPKPLEIGVNSGLDELAPAISTNENRLLFTRPLPEEAKADDYCQQIFLIEKDPDGNWKRPTLLSPSYNSGCEVAPYFAHDNKTFYFSSYRDVNDSTGSRLSRKNFNVFWARVDGLFEFQPKPVLEVLNEDNDQVSFSMDAKGNMYYGSGDIFASNEKRRASRVLYGIEQRNYARSPITLLSGQISDRNDAPLQATIQVVDPFTSKVVDELESNADGTYQSYLLADQDYQLIVRKETYCVQSRLIQTSGSEKTEDFGLFQRVAMDFNVFDFDYYFPLTAEAILVDENFKQVDKETVEPGEGSVFDVPLGQTYHVIFSAANYLNDTLHLPFDDEVLFPTYTFDIELERELSGLDLVFTDDVTGENLNLEITIYNVTRNEKITRTVKDGKIHLDLREGEEYEISTSAQGYSYYTASVDLTEEHADEQEITAALKSIENASLVLENITFEYNSYNLNAASYEELNKLVDYLQSNGGYRVEISAYTDDSGGEGYNLKLSEKRAGSVLEYLQDHAINSERLIAVGYGEANPLHPNTTEENRALNRRVEFKILNPNETD